MMLTRTTEHELRLPNGCRHHCRARLFGRNRNHHHDDVDHGAVPLGRGEMIAACTYTTTRATTTTRMESCELPQDVWLTVVQFLNRDNIDLRSLTETCYMLNHVGWLHLQRRWQLQEQQQQQQQLYDSTFTDTDGLIQRLTCQDPNTASHLFRRFLSMEDVRFHDDNDTDENLSGVLLQKDCEGMYSKLQICISRIIRRQQERATNFLTSSLQQQRTVVQGLRQQLSDSFLDAITIQRNLAILLYTHTSMGVILVMVVSIGLFWVKTHDDDDDNLSSNDSHQSSIKVVNASTLVMRLFVVLAFASTVAFGISRQTKNQQQKQQQRSLRRSVSQPELVRKSEVETKKSLPRMKRSQTVASGLVSYDSFELDTETMTLVSPCDVDETLDVFAKNVDCTEASSANSFWFDDGEDNDQSSDSHDPIVFPTATIHSLDQQKSQNFRPQIFTHRIPPRGCVGAFARARMRAKNQLLHLVHRQRFQAFDSLSPTERTELSTAFLNACSNDNALVTVRMLSRSIPTQDFYIGSDGTESCALHIAAFHGSAQIIDFLCSDIDSTYHPSIRDDRSVKTMTVPHFSYIDGGLCDVNVMDANGWTALHYAAGANSVDAVRILVKHGAKLNVEAVNGYTPLQWAIRLQHHAVAEALRHWIASETKQHQKQYFRQLWQQIEKSLISIMILSFLLIPNLGLLLRSKRDSL
jgi:Ankyrin repeats (3 copies)